MPLFPTFIKDVYKRQDMLNEGWDVLNLFDIVRLYETRQSGRGKIAPYTIKEAQLIGLSLIHIYLPLRRRAETRMFVSRTTRLISFSALPC